MSILPSSVKRLIDEFCKLPGIGPKTAERLTLHLLKSHERKSRDLGDALLNFKNGVILCGQCLNLTDQNICQICGDPNRDQFSICVVEEILDVLALEKTGEFKGVYHVLHGAISPLNGISPDELRIKELFARIKNSPEKITEVILATNPTLEGEATAMYIARLIKPLNVKITRIARGLPVGGDLEYADNVTLKNALEGRKEYE